MTNVYSNVVTVSVSGTSGGGGGGYPQCPDWFIMNPDGTFMGLELITNLDSTSPILPVNNVDIYYKGNYYSTQMLYKNANTNAWYVDIPVQNTGFRWYHVISGQCTPVSVNGSGTCKTDSGLVIQNFDVHYNCTLHEIVAQGYLYLNGQLVTNSPYASGQAGFCSAFDFNNQGFFGGAWTYQYINTDSTGKFWAGISTNTPPGGANCIVVRFEYNNHVVFASMSVTIPTC